MADIAKRCAAADVVPGSYTGNLDLSAKMLELGYRFMPAAADTGLLEVAARDAVSACEELASGYDEQVPANLWCRLRRLQPGALEELNGVVTLCD